MPRDDGAEGGPPGPAPSAPTEGLPEGLLAAGQVLGERYQIRSQLGRGGMGEVWRAFDLKLRVEVALKALRQDLFKDEGRRDLLRREVRAAREVVSPNVCRIFDLIEADGSELVSMEYVDGGTLLEVLQERGPLDLKEAQDIASQFLAGLEAIHKAGLVHRDVKPENIMLTRAGRVVLMDFGLARQEDSGAGTVSGTPAYMAPEQAMGGKVDARADVYSAGVVLAEMVSPDGIKNLESRQSVWEGIRQEPARVPDSPWAPVLKKAVAKEPEQRYNSAHTLTRALEDVTLRVEGAEDLTPYPGLASFTEADAEYFFGREAEIEAAWWRLEGAHLLAIVGPSGAGKTSFIRAGLVPNKPAGWAIVRCTPGNAAVSSLARVMAREMAGDADAMELAIGFENPDAAVELFSRWRGRHDETLLIVDQFEELFTLNTPDQQARTAELLGRIALEANVRVLLSMRDDFLMECKTRDALVPVFESLTPLMPPVGPALRRALVQPAMKCGYRFEDDALVDEMLAEVRGERGALPLLAFAAARLWERRDKDNGFLTREAYQEIGGVGGALAQHAEATIDRIGVERIPIVRELFRNLVTAEGTRAVRDWNELLSIFDTDHRREGINPSPTNAEKVVGAESTHARVKDVGAGFIPAQSDAEEVLRELIDARLLTSYEVREDENEPTRRVEIIHESLLANWPRLVRWQIQDQEGAQLRDELRQAARSWDEHGRHDDRLWTGTAYKEYILWRERYPGGLTDLEGAFGSAMTSFAGRRRRRRRTIVAVVIAALIAGLVVVGSFWQRSVRETRRAEAEAAQRQAAQLLALGQLQLAEHPNAALAYAVASLETADNATARRFAVEALWKTPSALFLPGPNTWSAGWSPDGRWLALGGSDGVEILHRDDATVRRIRPSLERILGFTSDSRQLVTRPDGQPPTFHVWLLPEAELDGTLTLPHRSGAIIMNDRLLTLTPAGPEPGDWSSILAQLRSLDGTVLQELGVWRPGGRFRVAVDPKGTWIYSLQEDRIFQQRIEELEQPATVIGTHEGATKIAARPWRNRVVTSDSSGGVRIWDAIAGKLERSMASPAGASIIELGPNGRYVATSPTWQNLPSRPPSVFVFDLTAPRGSEPTPLLGPDFGGILGMYFSQDGSWLSNVHNGMVVLWNMGGPRALILDRHKAWIGATAFSTTGEVLTVADDGMLRKHVLSPTDDNESSVIWSQPGAPISSDLLVSGDGRLAVFTDRFSGIVFAVPLDGSEVSIHELKRDPGEVLWSTHLSLDPSGRFLAVPAEYPSEPSKNELRILNLVTGKERSLRTQPEDGSGCEEPGSSSQGGAVPLWLPDGRLVSEGDAGLLLWDLESGERKLLRPCCRAHPSVSFRLASTPDSQKILRLVPAVDENDISSLSVFDFATGATREINSHGNRLSSIAVDESGTVLVTGGQDGAIQVGPLNGGEPHLLFGHEKGVFGGVAISPDGRRLVSTGGDGTTRLWPMPDFSKPPLHTLPHDELIAKLKALTNLRAVRDPESSTGWKVDVGPFPGWAEVPEW